jgi:2-dehydro-3-deoxygalactonokinase
MFLALDWGNSNLRAAVLGEGGAVLRQMDRPDGAAGLSGADFARVLQEVRATLDAGDLPALASGAVGAREGWVEAPYVPLPAEPRAVAGGLVRVPGAGLHIVPGLSMPGAILRGEETQILGLGLSDGLVCLPGTHSKWVRLSGGRVTGFRTYMTGQLFALLAAHSHLTVAGDPDCPEGFADGLSRADTEGPLSASLFRLRSDRIQGALAPHRSRAALAGLLIGAEVTHAKAMAQGEGVILCADRAMTRRYGLALTHHGVAFREEDGNAAAWRGLAEIARIAGLDHG